MVDCFPTVTMARDAQHSGEIQLASDARTTPEHRDDCQQSVLETAVEKLLRFGEYVGVTPEDMIRLLDSGLTIGELLDYLASRRPLHSKCPPTGGH